jgi:hypothetical protein
MLRVTLEIIPDEKDMRKTGTIVRIIDIKEDGSGTWQYGNYKTQFYNTPGSKNTQWRYKQVVGLPYKGYSHEKLLYLALEPYLKDLENGTLEAAKRATITDPDDRSYRR